LGVFRRNPRLQHYFVRLLISGCYLGVIVLLNTAPKLLDPAVGESVVCCVASHGQSQCVILLNTASKLLDPAVGESSLVVG